MALGVEAPARRSVHHWALFLACKWGCCVLVTQSCDSATPWPGVVAHQAPLSMDSLGKNTGVCCHSLLQGFSWPRDWTWVSCIAGRYFIIWVTTEVNEDRICFNGESGLNVEKEMATHSSVLAWRIPGMAEPDGLPSVGSHRVGHDWSDLAAAAAGLNEMLLFPPTPNFNS